MPKLSNLSVARFAGADAAPFLHAQLSADIEALEPGNSTLACYCSPRGQVLGLLLVCRSGDDFLVLAAASLLPSILDRMRMFVLRSSVEFSMAELEVYSSEKPGNEREPSEVYSPPGLDLAYWITASVTHDDSNPNQWKAKELRHKLTWLSPASSEKFIPQMLGFDQIGAVNFAKGCYPGQEIVARAKYLGKVKRKPLLVLAEPGFDVPIGSKLKLSLDGDTRNGILVDSVTSDDEQVLLFVVAPQDPAVGFNQIEFENRIYLCATI